MASTYPTSLDNFTNPTVSDYLNSTTVPHATQHSDLNDAVENLQAKVGIDSSADTGSIDYKVTDAASRITTLEAGATANAIVAYADLSARTAANPSPSEGDVSWQEDTNRFDIYDGTSWVEVGGGKIVQVVSTTKTDTFTTTSTSFADVTGLSLTITPTSATSKVLVFSTLYISGDSGASTSFGVLVRDSTSLFIGDADGSRIQASFYGQADVNDMFAQGITYLDSPATTSAVTYKVQVRSGAGPGVTYVNRTDTDSNNNQYGRFASSVTALEVAG